MRNKAVLFLTALIIGAMSTPLHASASTSASSAALATTTVSRKQIVDNRGIVLKAYLQSKDSPLQDDADTLIAEADKNRIDWRLLTAISGVESTYCHAIPYNSYNCWGYGIYGNHTRSFASWKDAVVTISAAIRSDYIDRWGAQNVYQIGRIYAASPTWASRVDQNMINIQKFSTKYADATLPITP